MSDKYQFFVLLSVIFGFFIQGNADVIYLNNDKPSYINCLEDIEDNTSLTVCVNKKNDGSSQTLQLLLTHMYPSNSPLSLFSLYDSADMSNFTGTLDSDILDTNSTLYPRSIYSHSSCFTIFHKKYDGPGFNMGANVRAMFRIVQAYEGTCNLWPYNVFDATSNASFVADTMTMGKCDTIILASCSYMPLLTFASITPTVDDGLISNFLVKNAINGVEYFKSDYNDTLNNGPWYNVSIYAPAISIVTTAITVMGTVKNEEPPAIVTFSGQSNMRGIVASPKYSGIQGQYFADTFLYQFITQGAKITFTMKHHEGNDVIIYDFSSKNYSIKAGETISITTSSLGIYNNENSNYLMEYLIVKVKNNAKMADFCFILFTFTVLLNFSFFN